MAAAFAGENKTDARDALVIARVCGVAWSVRGAGG
jgi:hypothetical protein